MTDMLATVIPKSDQLNFDDLSNGRTLTIKITKVSGKTGDQPICINYENDGGKPYYPCKSMRRVLIHNWGGNGNEYVGRSLTLYGDPTVRFGGLEVGGIRISNMSHINKEVTMALTATKASRKPFTVQPLKTETSKIDEPLENLRQAGRDAALGGGAALDAWLKALPTEDKKKLASFGAEIRAIANEVDEKQNKGE